LIFDGAEFRSIAIAGVYATPNASAMILLLAGCDKAVSQGLSSWVGHVLPGAPESAGSHGIYNK